MNLGVDYASVDSDAKPNLKLARSAGLRFAFLRGTYVTWADPMIARDRDAIRAASLRRVMTAASRSPEEQVAAFVLAAGLDRARDFAPVIDLEFPGGIAKTGTNRDGIADWIGRAIHTLEQAYGCKPIVYSSARVLDGSDEDSLEGAASMYLAGCPLWLARYPYKTRIDAQLKTYELLERPPVPKSLGDDPNGWWFHQFQGDALHFPGFTATVDLDRYNPLALGSKGMRVAWLQQKLGLDADGMFGPATEAAVNAFQVSRGISTQPAVVDVRTFAALSWMP